MKKLLMSSMVVVAAMTSQVSMADIGHHDLVLRLKVERSRIDDGVKSGALSKREAAELYAGQDEIEAEINRARRKHIVLPHEHIKITMHQAAQALKINEYLGNAETARVDLPPPVREEPRRYRDHDGNERMTPPVYRDDHPSSDDRQRERLDALYDRQMRNQRSIEWGVRHGSLSPDEASYLEDEQSRLSRAIERARRDGWIDREEFSSIYEAQNRLREKIRWEKEDNERWHGWERQSTWR